LDKKYQDLSNNILSKTISPNHLNSSHIKASIINTKRIFEWELDVSVIQDKQTLCEIAELIFMTNGFISIGIELETFRNFINKVADNYNDNRFHNFRHAVAVLHFLFMLLNASSKDENSDELILSDPSNLPQFVQFSLMCSALLHDLDHPGHTNALEINSNSELALKYNNVSVLENYHIDFALELLELPECNILENLSENRKKTFKTILKGNSILNAISHLLFI